MRIIIVLIFFILGALNGRAQNAQNIEETIQKFWVSVNAKNKEEIKSLGFDILSQIGNEDLYNDSSIILIRLYTADACESFNAFEESLKLNIKTLKIIENKLGTNNDFYEYTLKKIAWDYSSLGDNKTSLEYNFQLLNFYSQTVGVDSYKYAVCLNNIAGNFSELEDFEKSLKYNVDALKLFEKLFGKKHSEYAESLHNLSCIYQKIGNYEKSLEINLEAIKIFKKTVGELSPQYTRSLIHIANNFSSLGQHSKSLNNNEKALKIIYQIYGKDHPEYANCLSSIAVDWMYLGDYNKSMEISYQALELREKTLGISNIDYAYSLNNISALYSELGDYKKSLEYCLKSLKIREEIIGNDNLTYAKALSNLALIYSKLGDYSKSLEYNLEAMDIRYRILGHKNPEYYLSLNNIALDYSTLGDHNKSIEIYLNLIKLMSESIGEENLEFSVFLSNIASIYSELDDCEKSLNYSMKAIELQKKILGENNLQYANTLSNTASFLSECGKSLESISYSSKALEIRKKILGVNNLDYANSLHNIAHAHYTLGEYSKSLEYNFKALEIYENIFGKMNLEYAKTLKNIGNVYYNLGDYNKSMKFQFESFLIEEKTYFDNLNIPKNGQLQNKRRIENSFMQLTEYLFIDTSFLQQLARSWFSINNLINTNYSTILEKMQKYEDSTLSIQLTILNSKKKLLARSYDINVDEKKIAGIDSKRIEDEISLLELDINRKSHVLDDFKKMVYPKDVTNILKTKEYFVDIVKIPKYNFNKGEFTGSLLYLVFISNSDDTLVDYVIIENGLELEKNLYTDYKIEVSEKRNASDLKNEIYYNSFWKPIADKIGDANTVYVSLGGFYNNINLYTLYNPATGKYLIEEKDIRIVNSARDFVLMKEREKKVFTSNTSALYGFPDFNGNASMTVDTMDYFALTRDLDQQWIDSLTRGGMKAAPLPSTKVEVDQIAATFQKNGWNVKTYTGMAASEGNIKQEESPRVLHVATHGYFFEDIPLDKTTDRFLGMDRQRVVQDPMLRSGLLMTGANKTLQGEEMKGENGLLSAAEASLIDLRETELVVLSACETGKGEVKNSEGVYGLRKAFSDAGARNIIMSLWKVDDKVTQEFMTRFYEIWLNEKTSIREAFNRTQLEIKAKYPQPFYWGAFILVGE